jgi:hypothetical protein
MKADRLQQWFEDLYVAYKCDPSVLYLTAESHVELSEDILGDGTSVRCDMGLEHLGEDPVGVIVTSTVNPVTGSLVSIIRSGLPVDYFLTTLCLVDSPVEKPSEKRAIQT